MKFVKNAAVIFCLAGLAQAASAKGYGTAGCGLGSLVFNDQPGMIQILAATTNGTSGSQTFGISSGTSNCTPGSKMAQLSQQQDFVAANFPALSKDMARGEGETLTGLASSLGCKMEIMPTVAAQLKTNYGRIFAAPGAISVLKTTKEVLKNNSATFTGCDALI